MTPSTTLGILPVRQTSRAEDPELGLFLDDVLASIAANRIAGDSSWLPVLILVSESTVHEKHSNKNSAPARALSRVNGSGTRPFTLAVPKAGSENPQEKDTFVFGQVTICLSTMETRRNGELITLTCQEFKVLSYLLQHPRQVLSREKLLQEVWGYNCYPSTRTVDNHILRLRQKLELEPNRPKHFVTVFRVGYKFMP